MSDKSRFPALIIALVSGPLVGLAVYAAYECGFADANAFCDTRIDRVNAIWAYTLERKP